MSEKRTRRTRVTREELLLLERYRRNEIKPKKPKIKTIPLTIEERKSFLAPCLHCGHVDLRVINLHHINKVKYPKLVIPLCFNCHMLFHRLCGQKQGNETALEVLECLKKAG